MASTSIVDSYSTGMNNNKVKIKVSIANAQIAKSTVRLNKKALGDFNDSFELELGNARDLWAQILYIDTTEADVNPDSNTVSFKLEITGGDVPYMNSKEQTISKGGYVLYTAEITFIP